MALKKADSAGPASSTSKPAQGEKEAEGDAETVAREGPRVTTRAVKDFAPRPSKFPITDVAMEPPTLSLTKSMKKNLATNRTPLPISSAQKRCLEIERDKAVKRYREMKEERFAQQQ